MRRFGILFLSVVSACLILTGCASKQFVLNGADQSKVSSVETISQEAMDFLEDSGNMKEEKKKIYLHVGEEKIAVSLADNSSAEELFEILQQEDILYTADDYGGFEKVGEIGRTITSNNEQITTAPGDVILYQGDHICLYYGKNSWSFTRLGTMDGYSTQELKKILNAGKGEIEVRISIK